MNYQNIENEIDRLLQSDGLNPYERKFFKKIKRHLSQKNDRLKRAVSLMRSFRASSDQNAERGEKLRSRMGRKLQVTGILSILRNPFYYGEMLAKGKLHIHVYQPLISKETFDACQRVLERSRCKPFKHGEKPFTYRGLIHCANTGKICPIDIKKQQFHYVVCWAADGQRRVYIPLEDIDDQICYILNSIEIPAGVIEQIRVHLAASKKQEVAFRNAETGRLKQELTRIENRIDALFNMRLDGEIDKETYNDKNDRLQLERHRVEEKIAAHKKADNSFNDTVLNLMEIARSSATIFKLSDNVEKKRLLLSFLFDRLELNEGRIGYKLRYPFNEFQNTAELCEPAENQGVAGENGRVLPFPENEAIEPKKDNKNKGLPEKTSLCSGWLGNLDNLRTHHNEIKDLQSRAEALLIFIRSAA